MSVEDRPRAQSKQASRTDHGEQMFVLGRMGPWEASLEPASSCYAASRYGSATRWSPSRTRRAPAISRNAASRAAFGVYGVGSERSKSALSPSEWASPMARRLRVRLLPPPRRSTAPPPRRRDRKHRRARRRRLPSIAADDHRLSRRHRHRLALRTPSPSQPQAVDDAAAAAVTVHTVPGAVAHRPSVPA